MLIEQEDEVHRLGELGPARVLRVVAEPAVLGVELLGELDPSLGGEVARERQLAPVARAPQLAADDLGQALGRLLHLRPLLAPGLGDPVQDGQETRNALRGRAGADRSLHRTGGRRASRNIDIGQPPVLNAWSAAM